LLRISGRLFLGLQASIDRLIILTILLNDDLLDFKNDTNCSGMALALSGFEFLKS
tara:strand:- start:19 stop:183 length:165 start_codon:yes stop_codon:yes gene_type:complete